MADLGRRDRLQDAVSHHVAGRVRDAAVIYQDLLRAAPGDADLMQRLGVALAQLGSHEDGARLLSASLQLKPDRPAVLLNLARALLSLGRADDALRCCDRVVVLDRSVAEGFRVRGSALAALHRMDEALASLGQAVRLAPTNVGALVDLGVVLASAGRAHDAQACLDRAVALDDNQAPAHHNVGLLAARRGDHAQALLSFDRALALQPHHAALHNNRATSLKELARLPEALQSYTLALAIEPGNGEALHNRAVVNLLLGRYAEALEDYDHVLLRDGAKVADLIGRGAALVALDRPAEALKPLERAIGLQPKEQDAHVQLGVALLKLERREEAVASFDRALAIKRDRPEVLNNRGVALAALGRMDEALESFIESAAIAGDVADTHTNMGVVFKSLGKYREAAWSFDRALLVKHNDPAASFEAAFLHLTLGDFRKGWRLYEARFDVPALKIPKREFNAPRWDGFAPLAGRTLLVHAEQGLGDAIQFARYLPLLVDRGAVVVFEVMAELKALMSSLPGAISIVGRGREALPAVDYHCPLLSLPLALDTQLATIPRAVPYLISRPERVAAWVARLRDLPRSRVGIAWQGNVQVEKLVWAYGRSIPLAAFAPLAALDGVSLVSLQKGLGAEQLRTVPFRDRIHDLSQEIDSGPDAFLDTAAIMSNLDLVITSDTSIAHLAGALGRPVWIALSASADWRWLLCREDSPWYPSMRLFRQEHANEGWGGVMTRIGAALEKFIVETQR